MNKTMAATICAAAISAFATIASAEAIATIASIEGNASILRKNAADWRPARPNMSLELGDQLFAREESFVEVRYAIGTVIRLDENTKITLEVANEQAIKTTTGVGKVWINMKKITTKGRKFDVSSPTATASIRGTSYAMSTSSDSTTAVSVYDGKVAVGPGDELARKQKAEKKTTYSERVEVGGPEEIPGPYEVSLEDWRAIVSGQQISVRKDGKFLQEKFDPKAMAAKDSFIKKNQEMDKQMMENK